MEKQSIHWERQDLLKKINKRIGAETDITSLVMKGVYGSATVIDELIDCLGIRIEEGALETLNLEILPHERLTELTSSVFDFFAGKCKNLTKFELKSTEFIESEQVRQVIHDFAIRVICNCDPAKLTMLELIEVASKESEVVSLLDSLQNSQIQSL